MVMVSIHTIMSTTNHQKLGSLAVRELWMHRWKHFWAGIRVSVSAGSSLDLGKLSTIGGLGAPLEVEGGKMRTGLHTESSISQKKIAEQWPESRRICVVNSALLTLHERWSIWCDVPAFRVATGCDKKMHWHGRSAENPLRCCDAPALWDCSWGC